jgi:fatty acid desaturase
MMAIALLVATYVGLSAVEYLAHRWPMHSASPARRFPRLFGRAQRTHARVHHQLYRRDSFSESVNVAAPYVGIDLHPTTTVVGMSWLWAPLLYVSPAAAAAVVAIAAVHGALWTAVHREMHDPEGRCIARLPMYRFWRSYHKTHHQRTDRNFNALVPLFDFICGTYGGLTA